MSTRGHKVTAIPPIKEFQKGCLCGATSIEYGSLDLPKAHVEMRSQQYLMLFKEYDMDDIKEAMCNDLHASTVLRDETIVYLNRYRYLAQAYRRCAGFLNRVLWKSTAEACSGRYEGYLSRERMLMATEEFIPVWGANIDGFVGRGDRPEEEMVEGERIPFL